jgi:hypothetical protein
MLVPAWKPVVKIKIKIQSLSELFKGIAKIRFNLAVILTVTLQLELIQCALIKIKIQNANL